MLDNYDFSESRPNPYVKRERKAVTMNLDQVAIDYFKNMAAETGIPYQNLINLYLVQCAREDRKLVFS
ncbi:antitoxin [Bifidobacterium sp. DSM 109958]|uniref:Antitoxin n=1 Tax=Bifidobacterium moraviense TaxID=2675323 RepID=A0A7Y0F3H9_9BIFI|nr:antitoxin [Bifidobacterium sp. DSM 109958]